MKHILGTHLHSDAYCIFGNVIRYDNECRDYYQRFDSWLESPPAKKTIAVTPAMLTSIYQMAVRKGFDLRPGNRQRGLLVVPNHAEQRG
jgi:hypothetical protein